MKIFRYGLDAPAFVIGYFLFGLFAIILDVLGYLQGWSFGGIICILFSLWMAFSSLFGKSIALDKVLKTNLPQDKLIKSLDIGTGRGLVLAKLARHDNVKIATGIDLWSNKDQSSNAKDNTIKNMELEGLASKTQVDTGNMLKMPYENETFNVVTASFSIHNVGKSNVNQVCQEIYRVAAKDSIIIIFDIMYLGKYKQYFQDLGADILKESLPTPLTFPCARTLVIKKV